jgi:signal transduction histidine kinase
VLSKLGHELRGPLNGISGLAGVMLMKLAAGPAEPAQQIRQLHMIQASTAELLTIIERLVEIARLDTSDADTAHAEVGRSDNRAVDGTAVVAEVMAELQPLATAVGVHLVVETPDRAVFVDVGRGALHRLLTELIDNAVKYTNSTQVRVRVVVTSNGSVRIDVSDDGPGIARGEQERIFAAFERGEAAHDRAVPGSGLGLYLARKIAIRYGIEISLRSAPGQRSTFTVDCAGWYPSADG